jgi:hypothetical protein
MGQGNFELDVLVLLAVSLAAFCQAFNMASWFKETNTVKVVYLFSLLGWTVIAMRCAYVMYTNDDILISVAGSVGFILMGVAEIIRSFDKIAKV